MTLWKKLSDNCGVQAGWEGGQEGGSKLEKLVAPKAGLNSAGIGSMGGTGGAGRMGSCGQTM